VVLWDFKPAYRFFVAVAEPASDASPERVKQTATVPRLQKQAFAMHASCFKVNSSFLNTADCVAIIVAVPVLDSYVYPWIDKSLGRKFSCASSDALSFQAYPDRHPFCFVA